MSSVAWYTSYDEDGEIIGVFTSEPENLVVNAGAAVSVVMGEYLPSDGYITAGSFVPYTAEEAAAKKSKPGRHWKWSNSAKVWTDQRSLAQAKAEKWKAIKAQREAVISSPLTTSYGVFDADAASRAAISETVTLVSAAARRGPPGVVKFTLADNTSVVLDYDQLDEVASELHARTQDAHEMARYLRKQIADATAVQLESIVWLS